MSVTYKLPDPPKQTNYPLVSPRGSKLATRVWPVESPRALVVMVHGGGWHSGYFEPLALRLNQENLFVAGYDQVCMGYSDPEPGSPAGYIHVRDFDDLIEDLWEAVRWARMEVRAVVGQEKSLELPVFLLGESFGGLQVLTAGLDKFSPERVPLAGVITLGAVLKIAPHMLPPSFIIRILSFCAPYYPRIKMPATDFSSTFDDAFGDKKWAEIARQDPAVQVSPRPTLAGAVATVATGDVVAARAREWDVPLLAIHAIHDSRALCEPVRQFVDQAGPHAEGFWVDDTFGHQLLQDRYEVTKRVMDKIAQWIVDLL